MDFLENSVKFSSFPVAHSTQEETDAMRRFTRTLTGTGESVVGRSVGRWAGYSGSGGNNTTTAAATATFSSSSSSSAAHILTHTLAPQLYSLRRAAAAGRRIERREGGRKGGTPKRCSLARSASGASSVVAVRAAGGEGRNRGCGHRTRLREVLCYNCTTSPA